MTDIDPILVELMSDQRMIVPNDTCDGVYAIDPETASKVAQTYAEKLVDDYRQGIATIMLKRSRGLQARGKTQRASEAVLLRAMVLSDGLAPVVVDEIIKEQRQEELEQLIHDTLSDLLVSQKRMMEYIYGETWRADELNQYERRVFEAFGIQLREEDDDE